MKLKHKISLLIIGILLVVSLLISSSYALWVFNVSQESTNVLVSDCFEITFTEGSQAINLTNSFPMKDSKGVYTTPYEFTLKNICNHAADISINLETLNNSEIAGENLRVDVNGHIHTYGDNNSVEPTLDNASSAASFYNDTIASGKSKSYNLRLWIKEDVNSDNVINKSLNSKITVRSTLRKNYSEATLKKGQDVNALLKSLAGHDSPSYYTEDTSILSIQRSNDFLDGRDGYVNIADDNSEKPVYAWFDEGTIYIYSDADTIYLNSDCEYLFYRMKGVTSLDLSHFDTSKVTDMSWMFEEMSNLTSLDLRNFDTSNVTDMSWMFYAAVNLENFDLSHFDTSNVTDMSYMFMEFYGVTNLDLSNFNTSKVTNMSYMFAHLHISDLELTFDTSNVEDFSYMFYNCYGLTNLDISSFNTANARKFNSMFNGCSDLRNLDVSNFDTSNATDISGMFLFVSKVEHIDVSNWDTSKVVNFDSLFRGMSSLKELNISNFVTSSAKSFQDVFEGLQIEKLDVSNVDTSNVRLLADTFNGMSNIKVLDLSNWDTSKVDWARGLFQGCDNLETIYVGEKWNMDLLSTDSRSYIFSGNTNLVGGAGTTYNSNNRVATYAHIDCGTSYPGYLTYKGPLGDNAAYCASIGY